MKPPDLPFDSTLPAATRQSMRATLLRCIWLLPLALTVLFPAEAAEPTNAAALAENWVVRAWQTKDGLPQNTVNALAQTRDGYLWVGTSGGLARFDGGRFRVFGLQDGLASVRIATLLEDRQGVLWVGTTGGGMSQWKEGRFVALPDAEGLGGADVIATATEPDGTVWIGTDRGLLKWRDGTLKKIGVAEGLPAQQIRALLVDSTGTLWVSVAPGGLFLGTRGRFVPAPQDPSGPTSVYCLLEDREGSIWAGSDVGGVWRWSGGLWQRYGETNGLPKSNIEALAQGGGNVIWAGSRSAGLYFFLDGSFHKLAARTDSPLAEVAARRLLVDREGTLWVGTSGAGLNRVSRKVLANWGRAEGLGHPLVTSVAEEVSGGLWVGTQVGGIYRFLDQRFSKLADPAVLRGFPYFYSTLATAEGNVWAAGENCLFHFRRGEPPQVFLEKPIRGEAIRALCEDGTNLWLGTYYSTLLRCEGTNVCVVATNGSFGGDIRSMVREAPDTLWIGSASGLYRWARGQVRVWNTHDGLLTASVQSLHRDPDGTLWIGTLGGGLARLKHGRIANITIRQGLIDDIIHQIVPDDLGHLWLGCNHGIMRLSRQELDDCADGSASSVHPTVFGQDDGMLSEQCSGGHSPTALKTKDGRLLFPTTRGIVEIDPRRREEATAATPQASIDEVIVDDQTQNSAANVVIGAGRHHLEIRYAAPSLGGADWVRFRHRLEPVDKGWVNAGTRRTVTYDNLLPGRYVFRVAASSSKGTWNEDAASVALIVQPQFWQTTWFQALGLLAMGAVALAVYRRRIAVLERHRTAQEAVTRQVIHSQETERKRVASELHDGLSQNLALLAVELEMFDQRLPDDAGQIHACLGQFSRQTKGLSAEVHRISHGLHPAKLTQLGLAVALKGFCREVETAHGLPVRFEAREVPRNLPEDVALCLYRVTQEAIQNVVKHSGARHAQVELVAVGAALDLIITDDGKGFVVESARANAALGLVSMHERVRLVQGEITIVSRPGGGTRIQVRVPPTKEASS
jgi:signal transduction histidine kinase/ligand-binding sensor domain-containing protein